jgi:hypothetical protein
LDFIHVDLFFVGFDAAVEVVSLFGALDAVTLPFPRL